MPFRAPRILAFVVVSAAAAGALAAEGSIAVRPGDVVRGSIARCGDVHVFETELAKGETLRVRVTLPDPTTPPVLAVATADGEDVTPRAHVVGGQGAIIAGPFRAPASGVYRVSLTSTGLDPIRYEMTSAVKRVARRDLRLAANGRAATALVEAGSRFTLKTRTGEAARLFVAFPGETPRELGPDDPRFAALAGAGLAAPTSGSYSFSLRSGHAARIAVAAPTYVARQAIEFPALPDENAVTAWNPRIGWVATPGATAAPGHDPSSAPVVDSTPVPDSLATPLTALVAAPAAAASSSMSDAATWLGPAAGVGMPLAGAPSLAEVYASGGAPDAKNDFTYRVTAPRAGFGDVAYLVRLTVDGRPSAAPLSLTGRTTMSWSVTSAASLHVGDWTLSFDPVRDVQVLNGNETLTDAAGRTTSVAADGFALSSDAAGWPSGALTWTFDDPRAATSDARRETYDGTSAVRVDVGADETSAR